MSQTAIAQDVSTKATKPDFGNGRYSALMEEVWHDSQTVFKLESEKAEKLARQIASDLGAIMANQPVSVKMGKVNNDGKLTISEACKVKGITLTNNIYVLRALFYAGDAGKHGFSFGDTIWQPAMGLADILEKL